jgi:hypothetical protein
LDIQRQEKLGLARDMIASELEARDHQARWGAIFAFL